jgi:hypothetical protein
LLKSSGAVANVMNREPLPNPRSSMVTVTTNGNVI